MSLTGNNGLLAAAGANQPAYDIPYSVSMENGDKLSRTLNSTGAATANFTYSTWLKKSNPDTTQFILWWSPQAVASGAAVALSMTSGSQIRLNLWTGSASEADRYSTERYRDPGAWYHLVVQWNGATLAIYINNVLVDMSTSGNINGNSWGPQSGDVLRVGSSDAATSWLGYMADSYFIEGQTLAPSNFGEANEDTGQWLPIEYKGTFSGNSFYLDYADSSDLGKDVSGLGNHFTVTNLTSYDQTIDTPTNNFPTFNPLTNYPNAQGAGTESLTQGNRRYQVTSNAYGSKICNGAVNSGKWYMEVLANDMYSDNQFAWGLVSFPQVYNSQHFVYATDTVKPGVGDGWAFEMSGSSKTWNQTTSADVTTGLTNMAVGKVMGVAYDLDSSPRTLKFYIDNSVVATISDIDASGTMEDIIVGGGMRGVDQDIIVNFGQDSSFAGLKTSGSAAASDGNGYGDFFYAPPSGYMAVCTKNLPTPTIEKPDEHFNTVLYAGDNATSRSITGVGFQPDFSWIKNRTSGCDHALFDVVRGVADTTAGKQLSSNLTAAEPSNTNGHIKSFDSDGFSLRDGSSGSEPRLNTNKGSTNYASWNWKAGGSASSNSDGSITSSVSANTTAGFSIVKWTGTGSNATVGHGLSQAPDLVINKSLGSTHNWAVQSFLFIDASDTNLLYLNTNAAQADDTNVFQVAPTASVFSPQGGSWAGIGANGTEYIAYCFHSVEGYSKVGIYKGNGNADGTFIETGFRPAYTIIKPSSRADNWAISDSVRNTYNGSTNQLRANNNEADFANSASAIDYLSNGFKIRTNDPGLNNSTSDTYIYLAFAESPFKSANAR